MLGRADSWRQYLKPLTATIVGALGLSIASSLAIGRLFPDVGYNLFFWTGVCLLSAPLTKSRYLWIRGAGWLLPLLFFSLLFLSYGLRHFTSTFATLDIVGFLFTNIGQIMLHFLQQTPFHLAIFLFLWLHGAVILLWLVRRVSAGKTSGTAGACCLALSVIWMISSGYESPLVNFFQITGKTPKLTRLEKLKPRGQSAPAKQPPKLFPIIVIYLESWRHDLSDLDPTPIPFLRSILEEGYLFSHSYAAASHSNYSNPAFWFSQYPLRTRRMHIYNQRDPWPRKSVFTALKEVGYSTAYISSQNELWGNMIAWMKAPGVDYFFHSEDYKGPTWENQDDHAGLVGLIRRKIATSGKIDDAETLKIALDWVQAREPDSPFVLGLTLQNTHFNYYIPFRAPEPFQPSVIDFPTPYYNWPREKKEHVYNRYLNAVYNNDVELRKFILTLKESGTWDKTCVLITGDGGEAFHEHGFGNHSGPLYQEAMRSFTWIKPPKELYDAKWRFVEKPISHIDLIPSVFSILGLSIPEEFQGVPFQSDARPEVYLHGNAIVQQDAIIEWPLKFMKTILPGDDRHELYDLKEDPAEKNNLYDQKGPIVKALQAKLEQWTANQLYYHANEDVYKSFFLPRYEKE